eukprot:11795145-Karenia_brevis.AAC.1
MSPFGGNIYDDTMFNSRLQDFDVSNFVIQIASKHNGNIAISVHAMQNGSAIAIFLISMSLGSIIVVNMDMISASVIRDHHVL